MNGTRSYPVIPDFPSWRSSLLVVLRASSTLYSMITDKLSLYLEWNAVLHGLWWSSSERREEPLVSDTNEVGVREVTQFAD
jgi:hypothetical protein